MELAAIQNKIYEIRGQSVMLDFDLAELYQVETRVLQQSVRRNRNRFPQDFMFELTEAEINQLVSQNVIPLLSDKLKELENKYDKNFNDIYQAISYLLKKDKQNSEQKDRTKIGFKKDSK